MTREHRYFVYILASRRNGTLHVGVTSDLVRRAAQHRDEHLEGFTMREKRIKKWNRAWKLELIEKFQSRLERSV